MFDVRYQPSAPLSSSTKRTAPRPGSGRREPTISPRTGRLSASHVRRERCFSRPLQPTLRTTTTRELSESGARPLSRIASSAGVRAHLSRTEPFLRWSPRFRVSALRHCWRKASPPVGQRLTAFAELPSLPCHRQGLPIRLHHTVISGRRAPPRSGVVGRVQGYGSDFWRLCRGEPSKQTGFAKSSRRQERLEPTRVNTQALPHSKTPSTEKKRHGQEVFRCPHRRCRSHGFAACGSTPSVVSPLAGARWVRSRDPIFRPGLRTCRPFDRIV